MKEYHWLFECQNRWNWWKTLLQCNKWLELIFMVKKPLTFIAHSVMYTQIGIYGKPYNFKAHLVTFESVVYHLMQEHLWVLNKNLAYYLCPSLEHYKFLRSYVILSMWHWRFLSSTLRYVWIIYSWTIWTWPRSNTTNYELIPTHKALLIDNSKSAVEAPKDWLLLVKLEPIKHKHIELIISIPTLCYSKWPQRR